jgi:TonB family protein
LKLLHKLTYRIIILAISGFMCLAGYGQSDTLYADDGSILAVGTLEDGLKTGWWISYYPDGNVKSHGTFKNGFKVGEWTWYHPNSRISSIEIWKAGVYDRGKYWDENGKPSDIYEVLTNPQYPGGIEAFTQMISENIIYPEEVYDEGIEGRVVLEFTITAGGRLVNPVVKEPAHPELDEEALRAVQLSGTWTPAKFHDLRVPSRYEIPITFALQ